MPALSRRAVVAMAIAASVAVAVPMTMAATTGGSNSYPADKMTVSGAAFDVSAPGESVKLLEAHLRTSSTEDLILNASAECDILTQLHNEGNSLDTEKAFAQVKFYVKIDGATVPVSADDVTDPTTGAEQGKVVFCNREHDATSTFDNAQEFYETYLDTRSANSFQWVALNVGNGVHDIQLWADFTATVSGVNMTKDMAKAAVGKRTLVVEPTKAAHNEVVDSGISGG